MPVSWEPCNQETDEEIVKNFEYIKLLDIISEKHRQKTFELYEKHEYEINISSFNKLFSLLKMKTASSSSFDISIENEFNFSDYDYSEFGNLFPWYNFRKGANRIWVFLTNGVELGHQTDKKISTGVKIYLFFPKFTENEKEYLRNIQKILKIKFKSNSFSFYYKTDKGKIKSKKEKVKL